MGSIRLLDCTLRDGGFVNDWEFGISTIRDILSRLDHAGMDIIEVGFLDQRRDDDKNRSILPDTRSLRRMFENFEKTSFYVAMIDYGTCDIDKVELCTDSCIDGIRVIFKKNDVDYALALCKQIKDKGYEIFVQPVSVTTYSDVEIVSLINKVNDLNPFGLSIVDTYGLLLKKQLLHYYNIVDSLLNKDICLGYHAHNNFQLAYANCMEILEHQTVDRNLVLDCSVHGMGKGAGNCATELIATHLNKHYGKNYDIDQILEIADIDIIKFYQKKPWGYSIPYFLSASNDCHPSYVRYLLDKKTLSVKSINEIISNIPEGKKLNYHADCIEALYIEYQTNVINDHKSVKILRQMLQNKEILILAPGRNLHAQKQKINSFIDTDNPIVFAVNFIPDDYRVDYVFVGNAKRYSQFISGYYVVQDHFQILATSNVTPSEIPVDYSFNIADLLNDDYRISDNSTLLLINLLQKADVGRIYLAGFDGFFPAASSQFAYAYLDFEISQRLMKDMNEAISEYIKDKRKCMEIKFLTDSIYDN